jgi:WD40 repeat protein
MPHQWPRRVLGAPLASMSVVLCLLMSAALAQPPDTPFLRIEVGMHTAPIRRIDVDAQERFLVTASGDKTARVWSFATGELLKVLRPPIGTDNEGSLNAVAISPDGATVAAAGTTKAGTNSYRIYLFDCASGRLQRRISGLPSTIQHLAYSPDGRYLAAALRGRNGIRVYVTRDYGEIARDSDYGDNSHGAEFDHGGRLVTASDDGSLRLYDARFQRLKKRKAPGGKRPSAARFSPDGTAVAVGFDDATAVNVLSGKDLSYRYAPDTSSVGKGNLRRVAWSRDGLLLYAGGRYQDRSGIFPVLQWSQSGRGPVTRMPAATDTITGLHAIGGGRVVFGAGDPAFGVFDAKGTRVLAQRPAQVDYRRHHADLRVSHDGLVVEFAYDTLSFETHRTRNSSRIYLAEGRLLVDPRALQTALGLGLTPPRTEDLAIKEWKSSTKPTLDGMPLPLKLYEISRQLAIAPYGERFLLGTSGYLRLFDRRGKQVWAVPTPTSTSAVNLSGDGRLAIAAFGDGTLRWYRLHDGAERLALFLHTDGAR